MHLNAVGMKHTLGNMLAGTSKANSSLMFIHHLEKYVHIHIYGVLLLLAIHYVQALLYYTYTVPSRKRAHGWCTLHWAKTGEGANIRGISVVFRRERALPTEGGPLLGQYLT